MRISRASTQIAQTSAPALIRRQRESNMELTLTQNCALYYAQHKTSKRGATFFRKFRAAARKRALLSDSPHTRNFSGIYRPHRAHDR
jgi:hypothetical protein